MGSAQCQADRGGSRQGRWYHLDWKARRDREARSRISKAIKPCLVLVIKASSWLEKLWKLSRFALIASYLFTLTSQDSVQKWSDSSWFHLVIEDYAGIESKLVWKLDLFRAQFTFRRNTYEASTGISNSLRVSETFSLTFLLERDFFCLIQAMFPEYGGKTNIAKLLDEITLHFYFSLSAESGFRAGKRRELHSFGLFLAGTCLSWVA